MQKTTLLILLLFLGCFSFSFSQKKKELLADIASLRLELDTTRQALSQATRKISVAEASAETLKRENTSLRDANATLLKNLSGFSELSKKNSENANSALARLEAREKQLSAINDAFTTNDSTAIALLTRSKQILGDGSQIGVAGGDIVISNSLSSLFGSESGTKITDAANEWLAKIAQIAKSTPERVLVVEGLNITGEFDLTFQQVSAVAATLVKSHALAPENMKIIVKDGNFKEGINLRLEPNHEKFYTMVKKDVR
ncbi:hypothetical protein [Allomuricauda sp. d1]|uniref:hypothetical protein n=1 Tax=Allomuricauda sp. d1 TaxID=3136725 RepID=UPI0031DFA839